MSPNPPEFLDHLRVAGYHPRSGKHSNALAVAIVNDLAEHCPSIATQASDGRLVYDLNFDLRAGTADWNVDLVLGAPAIGDRAPPNDARITRETPSSVRIAIELKSVMTEHRKAVKNRKRDLEAHHEHVHNYDDRCIAGGVLIVNMAHHFRSPLRPEQTTHQNPQRLVEHCVSELRAVATRGGAAGYGLEAKCAIVVDLDNVTLADARFVTKAPASIRGDPLQYDAFIRRICDVYTDRFSP